MRLLEPGGQGGVGDRLGVLEVADVDEQERRLGGGGEYFGGVGPDHEQGQVGVGGQQSLDLGHGFGAPAPPGGGPDPAQGGRGRRGHHLRLGPEHERGEPVGDLDAAVGEGNRRIRAQRADRAQARKPSLIGKAVQYVGLADPLIGQQGGDEPLTGQPPRDVVLQVGVQTPVAGMQLGGDADRQHRGVERVEAEQLGGPGQPGVGGIRATARGQAERLIVGDVEAAQRVMGQVLSARDCAHRGLQSSIEKWDPGRGGVSRRDHAPAPRPRAPARRRAARRSEAPCSVPPAAG